MVALRVGASASSESRARALVRTVAAALKSLEVPGSRLRVWKSSLSAVVEAIYIDEVSATGSELKEPFRSVQQATRADAAPQEDPEHERTPGISTEGSSKTNLAERARFELAVSCPTTVFKTVTLNHSVTSPNYLCNYTQNDKLYKAKCQ